MVRPAWRYIQQYSSSTKYIYQNIEALELGPGSTPVIRPSAFVTQPCIYLLTPHPPTPWADWLSTSFVSRVCACMRVWLCVRLDEKKPQKTHTVVKSKLCTDHKSSLLFFHSNHNHMMRRGTYVCTFYIYFLYLIFLSTYFLYLFLFHT